jgi:hypothetical protein
VLRALFVEISDRQAKGITDRQQLTASAVGRFATVKWRSWTERRVMPFLRKIVHRNQQAHLISDGPTPQAVEDAFYAIFTSTEGRKVIDHLYWYLMMTELDIPASEQVGRQHVYRYIVNMMQLSHRRQIRSNQDGRGSGSRDDLNTPSNGRGASV